MSLTLAADAVTLSVYDVADLVEQLFLTRISLRVSCLSIFFPKPEISMSGPPRVAVVTGANKGIGLAIGKES